MKKNILACTILLFSSLCAQATETSFGDSKCGEWNKEPAFRLSELKWVTGYLSGLNHAVNVEKNGQDTLRDLTSDRIIKWMDAYCQQQPMSSAKEGAQSLFEFELNAFEKRKDKKLPASR